MRRITIAALGAIALAVAGCSSGDDANDGSSDGKPVIVASTDVYGSIASAVGGDSVTVNSLFANPAGDPHEFEASAQDTAELRDASVVVSNGGGYDAYVDSALEGTDVPRVVAYDLLETEPGAADAEPVNEHVFYSLETMGAVATELSTILADIDPAHADDYRENAATFEAGIDELVTEARSVGAEHPAAPVAQVEPLAVHLLDLIGFTDLAPDAFKEAIESGNDPAAADLDRFTTLLTEHQVEILILNSQTESPVTATVASTADTAGVPSVSLTESLPEGVTSYLDWQRANLEALDGALHPR